MPCAHSSPLHAASLRPALPRAPARSVQPNRQTHKTPTHNRTRFSAAGMMAMSNQEAELYAAACSADMPAVQRA